MNNRKLIYGIVLAVLVIGLLIFLIVAKTSKTAKRINYSNGNFTIWTVGDSKIKFEEFLSGYKDARREISNVSFDVVNFPNFKEYSTALNSALLKNKAPDIFVLNNNEKSVYEDSTLPLTNDNIDIHEFRQHYKPVFVSDLIVNTGNGDNKKSYLKGIPVGYETLGVFYNIKYNLIPTDFASLSSLKSAFKKIHHIWKVVPIAMGNGSTILNSGDLLAQQFLLNKINSLADITHSKLFKLSEYMEYGEGYNNYNKLFFEAKKYNKNNINLFLEGKVASIIAYPRVIKRLKSGNFTESFLAATAYPHSFSGDGPSLANYNYFVINKNTKQQKVAFSLLSYLNSDKGATEYLKKFNYYLPAKIKLEKELAGKKILEFYKTIELKDFYSDEPLSSFDKGNKIIFDEKIKSVLDDPNSYFSAFEKFKRSTLCTSEKILNLKNLTIKCE